MENRSVTVIINAFHLFFEFIIYFVYVTVLVFLIYFKQPYVYIMKDIFILVN